MINDMSDVRAVNAPELSLYWFAHKDSDEPLGKIFSSLEELKLFAAVNGFEYSHIDKLKPNPAYQTDLVWF